MDFSDLKALFDKGASLLTQGREALAGVKDAIADGKAAISATEKDELTALLDAEERETAAAIAGARDAIADYRAGE